MSKKRKSGMISSLRKSCKHSDRQEWLDSILSGPCWYCGVDMIPPPRSAAYPSKDDPVWKNGTRYWDRIASLDHIVPRSVHYRRHASYATMRYFDLACHKCNTTRDTQDFNEYTMSKIVERIAASRTDTIKLLTHIKEEA